MPKIKSLPILRRTGLKVGTLIFLSQPIPKYPKITHENERDRSTAAVHVGPEIRLCEMYRPNQVCGSVVGNVGMYH